MTIIRRSLRWEEAGGTGIPHEARADINCISMPKATPLSVRRGFWPTPAALLHLLPKTEGAQLGRVLKSAFQLGLENVGGALCPDFIRVDRATSGHKAPPTPKPLGRKGIPELTRGARANFRTQFGGDDDANQSSSQLPPAQAATSLSAVSSVCSARRR